MPIVENITLDQQLELAEADLLTLPADALVIEDNGWLTANRGLAAVIDQRYGELRAQREHAVRQRGDAFPIGSAVAMRLDRDTQPDVIVWAITFAQAPGGDAAQRVRATPIDVAAVTRAALHEAAAIGARHIAMPALGTRLDHHALPPTPKKLPRYVMAAAQLIGVQHALDTLPTTTRVTIALSHRDLGIFEDVLGRGGERSRESDNDDE